MANHINDKDYETYHPFLIIDITKNYIYGVQCSSVKNNNESYFSKNNIDYFSFEFTDTKFVTHVGLEAFYKLDINDIKKTICMSEELEFWKICNKLLDNEWKNTQFFNHNQIINQIEIGLNNYGYEKEIL